SPAIFHKTSGPLRAASMTSAAITATSDRLTRNDARYGTCIPARCVLNTGPLKVVHNRPRPTAPATRSAFLFRQLILIPPDPPEAGRLGIGPMTTSEALAIFGESRR